MSFPAQLSTTGAFSYFDAISNCPPSLQEFITTLSAKRGRLRDVLKKARHTSNQDIANVISTLEEYIPYLLAMELCYSRALLIFDKELRFDWRCTLLDSRIPTRDQRRIEAPSIYYELNFVFLTLAHALTLLTGTTLAQTAPSTSTNRMSQAADMLCRAAGIYNFMTINITPKLELFTASFKHPPPDISPVVLSALKHIALADAQVLALLQSSSKSSFSASLLARISISAEEHLSTAEGLLHSYSSSAITHDLIHYVKDDRLCVEALSFRFFGEDAEAQGRTGEAKSYLTASLSILKELKKSNGKAQGADLQRRVREQYDIVLPLERQVRDLNDRVAFQPEPPIAELRSRRPGGRDVLLMKEYVRPPVPLEFTAALSNDGGIDQEDAQDTVEQGDLNYAGKGHYW